MSAKNKTQVEFNSQFCSTVYRLCGNYFAEIITVSSPTDQKTEVFVVHGTTRACYENRQLMYSVLEPKNYQQQPLSREVQYFLENPEFCRKEFHRKLREAQNGQA